MRRRRAVARLAGGNRAVVLSFPFRDIQRCAERLVQRRAHLREQQADQPIVGGFPDIGFQLLTDAIHNALAPSSDLLLVIFGQCLRVDFQSDQVKRMPFLGAFTVTENRVDHAPDISSILDAGAVVERENSGNYCPQRMLVKQGCRITMRLQSANRFGRCV